MRAFVLCSSLALVAGCFNPRIKSGGFACDPGVASSCPSGYYCVDHLCVDHPGPSGVGGNGVPDLGSDGDLAVAPDDLARGGDDHDLAHGGPFDLSHATPDDLAMGSSCAHPICTAGTALVSGCDPCVTKICLKDSYCCSTKWSSICVGEVQSICGQSCP